MQQNFNEVNRTLYIPLYGKAYVSRKGIILTDKKAEDIWGREGFELKGKSRSKWLAYYMAMRARVYDEWTAQRLAQCPDAVVIHIGCGMDSRAQRMGVPARWYDVDFPQVIEQRRRYYSEGGGYHMLAGNAAEPSWVEALPAVKTAVVIMEGISMYLSEQALCELFSALGDRFPEVHILLDSYTVFAAKASKRKNPINDVGASDVWGFDDPMLLVKSASVRFVSEHSMTPAEMIKELALGERAFFRLMFGGTIGRRFYRMYEYSVTK